jgi:hypothetical protein
MSTFVKSVFAGLSTFAMLLSTSTQAGSFQNSSGLTGNFVTETFNVSSQGHNSQAANQFSGITFSTGNIVGDFSGWYPHFEGDSIYNLNNNAFAEIQFSAVMSDVGFAFASNVETTQFSAFLGSTLVASFSAPTGYSGDFYGFTGIAFDSIRIDSGGLNNANYFLDNLQSIAVTPVPEPETYAMMLAGLGLLGAITRRRKQTQH